MVWSVFISCRALQHCAGQPVSHPVPTWGDVSSRAPGRWVTPGPLHRGGLAPEPPPSKHTVRAGPSEERSAPCDGCTRAKGSRVASRKCCPAPKDKGNAERCSGRPSCLLGLGPHCSQMWGQVSSRPWWRGWGLGLPRANNSGTTTAGPQGHEEQPEPSHWPQRALRAQADVQPDSASHTPCHLGGTLLLGKPSKA